MLRSTPDVRLGRGLRLIKAFIELPQGGECDPKRTLLWWVNRELDGAMIDLGAAISGGMKRA
jgi:hypothetical protein